MAGAAGADLLVGGVRRVAAGVADRRGPDALGLPEQTLGAPEAAHAEHGLLEALGEGRRDRVAEHEVPLRHGHRLVAPGQRALGVDHPGLLAEQEGHAQMVVAAAGAFRYVRARLGARRRPSSDWGGLDAWSRAFRATDGVAFVVLVIVAVIVGGETPGADDPIAEVVAYWRDNEDQAIASAIIAAISTVPFSGSPACWRGPGGCRGRSRAAGQHRVRGRDRGAVGWLS